MVIIGSAYRDPTKGWGMIHMSAYIYIYMYVGFQGYKGSPPGNQKSFSQPRNGKSVYSRVGEGMVRTAEGVLASLGLERFRVIGSICVVRLSPTSA